MNVLSSIIPNNQKSDPSTGEQIDKCDTSINGILFSHKKEQTADTRYDIVWRGGPQKYYAQWTKPDTRDHILYDSIDMK